MKPSVGLFFMIAQAILNAAGLLFSSLHGDIVGVCACGFLGTIFVLLDVALSLRGLTRYR